MKPSEQSDLCEIHKTHPEALEMARLHEVDDETSLRLAEIFKILGDRTRIKLLSLLAHKEELCVCDIAEALGMGQSAISHQLRVLRNARLVKFRKVGKEAFYSLDDDHVVTLMQQGLDHVLHG
ncbi:metalloregulator ArsR/SmtB family transcription factor [uncultured Selenomonas sp.]|uniref:ArsR/SmtB family transcription factor n=1 Tax=uncultured Selenomonas sp. TaxID=159275 RepID=UPI0028061B86|nr:metalloregulator ArsR/SmtB family transcription factor [uncultured Selenomonas sp.]